MSPHSTHRFARVLFYCAGVYGLLVLLPMYFLEQQLGQAFPPASNRPEQYYGFLGVAVAWQLGFLLIARDVIRYRPMMVPAALEKLLASGAALWLFAQGRIDVATLAPAVVDLLLGLLFVIAFLRVGAARKPGSPASA